MLPRARRWTDNLEATARPITDAAARAQLDPDALLTRRELAGSWVCRLLAAGIMLETLCFKFTGSPESIAVFTKLNMEAWGRYGQGV